MFDETQEERDVRLGKLNNDQLDKRITGLREQNIRMMNQIAQTGVSMDLTMPRVEFLLNRLMALGIITDRQRLEEQENWEMHLRSEIQPAHENLMHQAQMAGAAIQQPSGLIIPGRGQQV